MSASKARRKAVEVSVLLPPHYPRAVLWRVLVRPLVIESKSKGGIILAPEAQRAKGHLRYVGQVLDMGPLAYHHDKFTDRSGQVHGACKVGDWICFGAYSGQQVIVATSDPDRPVDELRLLNDDEVLSVVPDPTVLRIYCD